jgi:hypothetical protein
MAPGAKQPTPAPGGLAAINWQLILTWFVRLVAVIWFIKGLLGWSAILGVQPGDGRPFDERTLAYQAIIVFFAVADLVAAVGLWLLAPWGGVVWIGAAAARVALGVVAPASLGLSLAGAAMVALAILAFVGLTWAAGRKHDTG